LVLKIFCIPKKYIGIRTCCKNFLKNVKFFGNPQALTIFIKIDAPFAGYRKTHPAQAPLNLSLGTSINEKTVFFLCD
jgi:hypothetical protein